MVRVLCLHGVGTNSEILKVQTATLRTLLPNYYQWHFAEGEEECTPAPGVEGIFPPPFLCFHLEPSCENMQDAAEVIEDVIESEGPFDAVLGFSQGGALAATVILKHQILKPFAPPPFRVAIFLCSNLPWSWDISYGTDVASLLLQGRSGSVDLDEWKSAASCPSLASHSSQAYLDDLPVSIRQRIQEKANGIDMADIPPFRRFHSRDTEKISIPTVHLCGEKDNDFKQSLALSELCDQNMAQVLHHAGGHEIPRDKDVNRALADAIERAMTRAELMM